MSEFQDQVEFFREQEKHEDAMLLLMDHALLKVTGLWRASMLTKLHSYPIDSSWRALWDCVAVDHKALSDLADETENRIKFQVARLIELRLIYPDGTRTAMATKAVMKFLFNGLS
ncbi:MAG: hypothetical protein V4451_04595 [Pseudomonadota bacterium]